jgi:phosphoserine phosphatase
VWGARKAAVVQEFCGANGIELQHSYFYADGDEDAVLMRMVGRPRPVNPRSGLAAMAVQHGWPVLRVANPNPVSAGRTVRSLAGLVPAILHCTIRR